MVSRAKASLKMRLNLGDFNSVEIGLEIEDDFKPGVDKNTAGTVDRLFGEIEKQLKERIEGYKS